MRRSRLSSYLRTERLRSGLSQKEFAELLGLSRSAVSKVEGAERPSLQFMLGAEIIFRSTPREIFPALYEALEYEILLRAVALESRLSERTDAASMRKRRHLGALINRLQFNQPFL